MRILSILLLIAVLLPLAAAGFADEDPYLWLEEVEGEEALAWVQERSDQDTAELEAVPEFAPIHERLLEIFNSRDRIPYAGVQGDYLYNFWQDAEHVRGIWRRTTLESYLTPDTQWETVLDLDALAAAEGENWVWKGAQGLYPKYTRYLISLSRGGGDAVVVREYDATKKAFVEDGFALDEAKSEVAWKDLDHVWVGTDFGEGSLTESGYPNVVKLWTRGSDLSAAETVFTGELSDVSSSGYTVHTPEGDYDIVHRTPEFFRGMDYLLRDGKLIPLEIPDDADFQGMFKKQMLVELRSDWTPKDTTYIAGSKLSIDLEDFLEGRPRLRRALPAVPIASAWPAAPRPRTCCC